MTAPSSQSRHDQRLAWEEDQLLAYVLALPADSQGQPRIDVQRVGVPPRRYELTYRCIGLGWDDVARSISYTRHHVVAFQLGPAYPLEPPRITVKTPTFHPNIGAGREGGLVCLREAPPIGRNLAEWVWYVGELLRMAIVWDAPATRDVFAELRRQGIPLPTDDYPFPPPPAGRGAPELAVEIHGLGRNGDLSARAWVPPGLTFDEFSAETLERLIAGYGLPSHYPLGAAIPYRLVPDTTATSESLPAVTLDAPDLRELRARTPTPPGEVLRRIKAQNRDVFDCDPLPNKGDGERYLLRFSVELFARGEGAYQQGPIVRTRHHEAILVVPPGYPAGQLRLIWETPIHHPQLREKQELRWPEQGDETDVARFFTRLCRWLNYESSPGDPVYDREARAWVDQHQPQVRWLQTKRVRLRAIGEV